MGYKLLLLLEKILMALPKSARKGFFSFLAFIAYHASPKYRKVVKQNLDFAFDKSMSEDQIKEITKYSFKNLLFNFMHILELRNISKEELHSKVTILGEEKLHKVIEENRSIIYVTPHYCSWELGGAAVGSIVTPVSAVYKKMKNPQYESWLLEGRSRFGNKNLEKTNVLKPLIKLCKNAEAIAILLDTNINKKDGVVINFFNKPMRQTATPAFLARKFNAAIMPLYIRTDDEENYTVVVGDEIVVEKSEDEKADILKATQLQADWLEKIIREEPKFWFWLHKRWKGDYPEIYNS